MPVWHRLTKPFREAGRLTVIGITQEQHPRRCRLFAQWHGIDWPILWDPFNTTGTRVVPRATLIDEHGVVRAMGFDPRTVEATFLSRTFEPPAELSSSPKGTGRELVEALTETEGSVRRRHFEALSALLWPPTKGDWSALTTLEQTTKAEDEDAAAQFHLGVAHRMRHDSPQRQPGDFQRAVDAWRRALDLEPRQYIYRRRIQQYGPRLDKPYPFYDWVQQAQSDVRARGEEPVQLLASLSDAERAGRGRGDEPESAEEPDPGGKIESVPDLVATEGVLAFHTERRKLPVARVHLLFRPRRPGALAWTPEAGPLEVWMDLPEGWRILGRRLVAQMPGVEEQPDVRVEFELVLPAKAKARDLAGYALFHACVGASDECRYLRHDFMLRVVPP